MKSISRTIDGMHGRPNHRDSALRDHRFILLFFFLLVWRVFYIWSAPIELSPDEAYYWEWSRRLAWGYYSKPPMVAWIMALSTGLLGNTAFAVRLPAAIFSTLSIWICYMTGRSMFNARTGWWAAALMAASPGACVAGLVMTIDAPLLFFWSLALFCVWEAIRNESPWHGVRDPAFAPWWLSAGIAAGAGFLTKQTMFAFWPVTLAFMFLGQDTRPMLKSWRIWASVAVSLSALVPVIWWNMQHGWITLEHTAHHFAQVDRTLTDSLRTFFEFLGSQLGIISPVTCILVFVISIAALMRFRAFVLRPAQAHKHKHAAPAVGLLLFTGIAVLLPIALLSLKQRVNANWPAPFYLSPAILIAAWHQNFFSLGTRTNDMRKLVMPGIFIGTAMSVLLYALPYIIPLAGLEGSSIDATARLRGWKELALHIESIRISLPAPEKTFIVARRRQTAAELAFYMPGKPMTYRCSGNRQAITTQYELWPGPDDRKGWDALVIVDMDKTVPLDLPRHFDEFRILRQVKIPLGNAAARLYAVYLGRNFHPESASS